MNDEIPLEKGVRDCYSSWSTSYYDRYYGPKAPYLPVHTSILRQLLIDAGATNVLDAGCGPASFLRNITDLHIELYGFDLTPEMVSEARRILNLGEDRIWEGNVVDANSYRTPIDSGTGFDAAICVGVFPHIPSEAEDPVFGHLRDAVVDGGLVVIEARNSLFSLFTLNRYSHRFFLEELIRPEELIQSHGMMAEGLDEILISIEDRFRMDLPPIRSGESGKPGYDEILSRTHNPLVIRDQFSAAGFKDVQTLFYHYHALPPMFESVATDLFREASIAMEVPTDWRGHFMASAFILTGRRS